MDLRDKIVRCSASLGSAMLAVSFVAKQGRSLENATIAEDWTDVRSLR